MRYYQKGLSALYKWERSAERVRQCKAARRTCLDGATSQIALDRAEQLLRAATLDCIALGAHRLELAHEMAGLSPRLLGLVGEASAILDRLGLQPGDAAGRRHALEVVLTCADRAEPPGMCGVAWGDHLAPRTGKRFSINEVPPEEVRRLGRLWHAITALLAQIGGGDDGKAPASPPDVSEDVKRLEHAPPAAARSAPLDLSKAGELHLARQRIWLQMRQMLAGRIAGGIVPTGRETGRVTGPHPVGGLDPPGKAADPPVGEVGKDGGGRERQSGPMVPAGGGPSIPAGPRPRLERALPAAITRDNAPRIGEDSRHAARDAMVEGSVPQASSAPVQPSQIPSQARTGRNLPRAPDGLDL